MSIIVSHFQSAVDVPLTSPTTDPTIRIRRTDTQVLVVTDDSMTEQGDGNFSYDFTPDPALSYSIRVDGDPLGAGQVLAGSRYQFAALDAIAAENIEAHAITAAKIATDAITADKIAASAITSSEAPALANLDVAVSTREAESAASTRASTNQTEHDATQALIAAIGAGNELATFTVAAGGDDISIHSDATQADDYFNGMLVIVTSGTDVMARRIDDYTQTNGVFDLEEALPFTPGAGDTIVVLGIPVDPPLVVGSAVG